MLPKIETDAHADADGNADADADVDVDAGVLNLIQCQLLTKEGRRI